MGNNHEEFGRKVSIVDPARMADGYQPLGPDHRILLRDIPRQYWEEACAAVALGVPAAKTRKPPLLPGIRMVRYIFYRGDYRITMYQMEGQPTRFHPVRIAD